jgi:K+-transporting ATPase ATPase A chain
MNPTLAGILFLSSLVIALALSYRPLGDYMARVFTGKTHWRGERVIYRAIGVDPDADQKWSTYLRSLLAFSLI